MIATFIAAMARAPDSAVAFSGGWSTYAWAFGQGVLVDLTPCVYPLIPITVALFGAKGVSRGRALFLATAYVLGMATLYTALGVVVAMTGSAFGTWLGNPWVVLPIAGLLVALAASMFGAFDVQLPARLQTRLNTVGGAGPLGAFLMGLVSGLISAPCTGPVLLALLAYIAKSSAGGAAVWHGGSLLFTYALGMGTLFFAVALGASLFRPGAWMEAVKSVFGIALLVMAYWFLRPLAPELETFVLDAGWGLYAGLGLILLGVAAGAVHLSFHATPALVRTRKAAAVAVTVLGGVLTLNNVLYVPTTLNWHKAQTMVELERALMAAEDAKRPVLIDFAAAWCLPCKEIELQTFADPRVERVLATRFTLIKIDVTDVTDEQALMQSALHSKTLPSVVVLSSDVKLRPLLPTLRAGQAWPRATVAFDSFVGPDPFLAAIRDVR